MHIINVLVLSLACSFAIAKAIPAGCYCDWNIPEENPKTLCVGLDPTAGCFCYPADPKNFFYGNCAASPLPVAVPCPAKEDGTCGSITVPKKRCINAYDPEDFHSCRPPILSVECAAEIDFGDKTDTISCSKVNYDTIDFDASKCSGTAGSGSACGGGCTARVYDSKGNIIRYLVGVCKGFDNAAVDSPSNNTPSNQLLMGTD